MSNAYLAFFGLPKEPFPVEVEIKDTYHTPNVAGVVERFEYAVRLGAMALITGDVGSGKTTALRYAASTLHHSEYLVLNLIGSSGSLLEFHRQVLNALGLDLSSNSKAVMARKIKKEVVDLVLGRKIKPVLIVDEASLIRMEVFAELHTITQFEKESRVCLPVILVGQNSLVDRLMYRTSLPLASRIVARSHLEGVDRQQMEDYLKHQLTIAGLKHNCYDEQAITAIQQGSGGIYRKANHLARGAMIAAAGQKQHTVTAEHVRIASSEIF
ncbi:MAG: AAA family ATPase [Pseudomonadota bacterium]